MSWKAHVKDSAHGWGILQLGYSLHCSCASVFLKLDPSSWSVQGLAFDFLLGTLTDISSFLPCPVLPLAVVKVGVGWVFLLSFMKSYLKPGSQPSALVSPAAVLVCLTLPGIFVVQEGATG